MAGYRTGRLSVKEVEKIVKIARRGRYADGGGLYLQIAKTGTASWIYRYKGLSSEHHLGIGPAHTIGLAEARERARLARKQRLDHIDPLDAKRQAAAEARAVAAKTITFRVAAEAYIRAHQAEWKNPKHAAQWPATLSAYAYPMIGDQPVQAIDTALVMKVLEPIWTTKPETASRLRGRIEAVLGWATVSGYRTGDNPARWSGHLRELLPKVSRAQATKRQATGRGEHHAALPYAEIGGFVAALRKQEGVSARALEYLILTAGRTGEVIGARWDEIDLDEAVWTIPADRMKAGREHRVALSGAAIAVLRGMAEIRQHEYVFPGTKAGRPLSDMTLLMLLRRMGRGDLTAHGFRSTLRDWAAERTNYPAEVAEMALAHTVGDKVEAAYRRGDLLQKRYALAEAWAKFCAAPAAARGEVVPMRKRS